MRVGFAFREGQECAGVVWGAVTGRGAVWLRILRGYGGARAGATAGRALDLVLADLYA